MNLVLNQFYQDPPVTRRFRFQLMHYKHCFNHDHYCNFGNLLSASNNRSLMTQYVILFYLHFIKILRQCYSGSSNALQALQSPIHYLYLRYTYYHSLIIKHNHKNPHLVLNQFYQDPQEVEFQIMHPNYCFNHHILKQLLILRYNYHHSHNQALMTQYVNLVLNQFYQDPTCSVIGTSNYF